ncbi:MAG: hypothetical protein ACOX9R_13210 [Armatimonadota bacterium]|jgi:hypothetical protein
MRSRWGIVLMVVALVGMLAAMAVLAGCPADTVDDGAIMPPPEEIPPIDEPMPEDVEVEEPADEEAEPAEEGEEGAEAEEPAGAAEELEPIEE